VTPERCIAVALPLPFGAPFTYRLPAGAPAAERGARVMVPFGKRRAIGVVVGSAEPPAGVALKDVQQVLDDVSLVEPPLFDLALWMADYYLAPPGECLRLVMPPAGIRASRAVVRLAQADVVRASSGNGSDSGSISDGARATSDDPVLQALRAGPLKVSTLAHRLGRDPASRLLRLRQQGVVELVQDLRSPGFRHVQVAVRTPQRLEAKGKAQGEILGRLEQAGGRVRVADLVRDRPSLRGAIARLVGLGALRLEEERDVRGPETMAGGRDTRPTPTKDQATVVEALEKAVNDPGFHPFLLHGVTGSGKTEVYFRVAERVLGAGKTVLMLVPEIALTPLLVRAAVARFGNTVAVQHSELSAGERHDQWWRIREGDARVVVGARSAVFAPLPALGLVVVDEEHEASYKQEDSPRYHARDVAVMRARLEGASVVLGSATPSLETRMNADRGKYASLLMPTRISAQGLPRVEIVDRRAVLKEGGDPILSPPLREALAERLVRKEQALLLLNRRGWATSLVCRECGHQAVCPNCSVCLTLHDGGRHSLCHYCGHRTEAARACPSCRGAYLKLQGFGTEKVVQVVTAAFPKARVGRLDRDLASKRGALQKTLAAFEAGETDILVGTQMIAKGHDFPRVTLVGVIDADVGLGLPDFRAAERTFQLLTQVAGRAGRADLAGEVILQSHWPDHYALGLACAQDYDGFFEREMEFRRTMGYPPVAALVNIVLRAKDAAEGERDAAGLARRLREGAPGRYRVLGPASAPLARLRGEHRFQILLKGQRTAMREAVRQALVERFGESRWPGIAVDVDPVSVM
jgi:primosomal protein N' (replication factor Y) (superfamily II helicase)